MKITNVSMAAYPLTFYLCHLSPFLGLLVTLVAHLNLPITVCLRFHHRLWHLFWTRVTWNLAATEGKRLLLPTTPKTSCWLCHLISAITVKEGTVHCTLHQKRHMLEAADVTCVCAAESHFPGGWKAIRSEWTQSMRGLLCWSGNHWLCPSALKTWQILSYS